MGAYLISDLNVCHCLALCTSAIQALLGNDQFSYNFLHRVLNDIFILAAALLATSRLLNEDSGDT